MSSVLVVMEQQGGKWHRMSWEALACGVELGKQLNLPVEAAVVGGDVAALADEAAGKDLAKVHKVEHALLASYTADAFTAAVEQLIRSTGASVVLFPHTYQVRDFAPKVATRFGRVLVSDVVSVRVADGAMTFVRQLFQGKMSADFQTAGSGPAFASIQAGAFRADNLAAGSATVVAFAPAIEASAIRVKVEAPFRESSRAVDLTAAEIIVSVGRGIKEKDNIHIVEELAAALGAELAASRPICDAGWLPMERQVGSSGQTVSPKVYLAVGISGAIQHLVGMKGSKAIVAINKDENAPIFEVADYGIIGDLFEVVPALVAEVKKAKGA
jgi:electron transfer flavoprotein alpha subunit